MKIAIISDIHENYHNTILALELIEQKGCSQIVFLGDFMNNGIAKVLASSKIPVFALWGNNDGEQVAITRTSMKEGSNLTMSETTYDFLEFDGKKIFATHYADLARPMATSGLYGAVFYGHDHKKNLDKIGKCVVVNPGEISAHKYGAATFAIYDTASSEVEFLTIDGAVTTRTEKQEEHMAKIGMGLSKSKRHRY